MRKSNQLHAHIETIKIHAYEHNVLTGKPEAKNPNYLYIIYVIEIM